MSYKTQIQILENEINELGDKLCEILVPLKQPYSSFLSFLKMSFSSNRYPTAIADLEWYFNEHSVVLPESALTLWANIKNKADKSLHLYELERQSDDGYKDPITHMNVLTAADQDTPNDFGKRYGLNDTDVKCLVMISPGFEERFIRNRIGDAVARNGARTGHYIFTKRRYKLTQEQAQFLVDEIWENPKSVSKVFYELLDWEKLLKCRLAEDNQERIRQIRADFGMQSEVI